MPTQIAGWSVFTHRTDDIGLAQRTKIGTPDGRAVDRFID